MVEEVNFVALAIAVSFSAGLIAIAYYVTPLDKEVNMDYIAAIAVAVFIFAAIFALYIRHQEKKTKR